MGWGGSLASGLDSLGETICLNQEIPLSPAIFTARISENIRLRSEQIWLINMHSDFFNHVGTALIPRDLMASSMLAFHPLQGNMVAGSMARVL